RDLPESPSRRFMQKACPTPTLPCAQGREWSDERSRLFQRFLGRRGGLAGTAHQQAGAQLGVDLVGDGGVVAQELAHVFLALADAVALVAVPGAGLVDQVLRHDQPDDLAFARGALAVQDLELGLAERRRHLVLHHLDTGFRTDDFLALLHRADAADIQAHRGVELQRVAAGGGLGAAEHHADLHADLVDEDDEAVRLLDVGGELAQRLAHQAGVQADVGIAHLAFDFRLRRQRGDRVDHHHVHRTGAHQHVGDFQRLLASVRLRDQQVVDVDAELFRIGGIERVFGIDERGGTAGALAVGDRLQGHGGLAGRLRAVDLDHAAARQTADAERDVQPQRTGGDRLDRLVDAVAHAHHGTLAELLFDLAEGGGERLALVVIHRLGSGWAVNGRHDARIASHGLRSATNPEYPTAVKPASRPGAPHSVRVFRRPARAAATVCRRTASRSPPKWHSSAWA